jgi:hypothetical protein
MSRRSGFLTIHGKAFGLSHLSHLSGEGNTGPGLAGIIVGAGADGTDYIEAHGPLLKATMFDDFLGKTISGQWNLQKGSDGATVNFANTTGNLGGGAQATMGANAGVSMATNGVQIDDGVKAFQVNKGSLVMETRIKTDAITNRAIFVGFTDTVASLLMPFTISGAVLTANAADAVGFLFDTAATAATLKMVGVANSVAAAIQDTAVALVAATYITLRVEVDSSGNAFFYINGAQVGTKIAGQNYSMAAALRATIPVSPIVAGFTRSAGTGTITLDWLRAQQDR